MASNAITMSLDILHHGILDIADSHNRNCQVLPQHLPMYRLVGRIDLFRIAELDIAIYPRLRKPR